MMMNRRSKSAAPRASRWPASGHRVAVDGYWRQRQVQPALKPTIAASADAVHSPLFSHSLILEYLDMPAATGDVE